MAAISIMLRLRLTERISRPPMMQKRRSVQSFTALIHRMLGDVGPVFYLSVLIIASFVSVTAFKPDEVEQFAQQLLDNIAGKVGWMYLLVTSGFVFFAALLAMIFSGGMGVGLVFWGVAEPMMHFNEPPLGIGEPRTAEAAQLGMRYAFFHWGFHQWASFTVVGLSIAYVRFRHNSHGLISETFRPLLGERVDKAWGKAIDILAVISTIFGVATTLGLGALQINSGLAGMELAPYAVSAQFMIIAGIGILFTLSAMTPLDKGIRYLSNLNMAMAGGLLLFVLIQGPTGFVFSDLTQTVGEYLGNIVEMSLVTTPYSSDQWVQQWTMFYWAWGLSWAPFVGSFIARISRGRTIREFVTGVMIVPVGLSILWFSTFGSSAIYMELFGTGGIADAVAQEVPSGLYALLDQLPGGGYAAFLAIALVSIFLITSADSATFVLGMFTSNGVLNPTRFVRILWGVLQLLMAAVLLLSGGLYGLRTLSILAAFPFMLLMLLMAGALHRDLQRELWRREQQDQLLRSRIEKFLLRESEREAQHQIEEETHPTVPEDPEK